MTETRDVLIAARALIDTPEKWFGKNVTARLDSLCMVWAVSVVTRGRPREQRQAALDALRSALPPSARKNIIAYNDTHTHRAVMRIMDRAIEAES